VLPLGKKDFVPDDRDIRLTAIAARVVDLPAPPTRFGFGLAYTDWSMLGNGPDDTVQPGFQGAGDCVWAGAAHETMLLNHSVGVEVPFTGAAVISDYSAATGYVIGDDNTDVGTEPRQAYLYRQATGIIDANQTRHKIGAFVALTAGDVQELLTAAFWFECVGIGIQFPDTAMDQFDRGEPWDVVPGAKIEGGHYIVGTGRRAPNDNGVLTWGKRQSMTDRFYETYNDESWAFVSEEELRNGVSRRGLRLDALNAALQNLGHVA
jgi:hypothetical protein